MVNVTSSQLDRVEAIVKLAAHESTCDDMVVQQMIAFPSSWKFSDAQLDAIEAAPSVRSRARAIIGFSLDNGFGFIFPA
jgi:hypothetical protein